MCSAAAAHLGPQGINSYTEPGLFPQSDGQHAQPRGACAASKLPCVTGGGGVQGAEAYAYTIRQRIIGTRWLGVPLGAETWPAI